MKPLYVFILCGIILAALATAFPDLLLNPGPLLKGHEKLRKSCLSCHEPFGGAASVRCISCHKPDDIGIRSVDGNLVPADSGKTPFHKALDGKSCTGCHADHRGAKAALALNSFRHQDLPPGFSNRCTDCHRTRKPADDIHRTLSSNCAECHGTKQWKPTTFDHRKFVASSKSQCISCHKPDRPNDNLHLNAAATSCGVCHGTNMWKPATFDHRKFVASSKSQCISCHKPDRPNDNLHLNAAATSCGVCHGTNRWKPATFDHNRYFPLDRYHRASCKTCHPGPSGYKTYTCYNCHEHAPAAIAAEHREEGIYRYDNCMKCHRSGKSGEHDD